MPEREPIEQLDQAIEAMLHAGLAEPAPVGAPAPNLAALLQVAAVLRELPHPEFKRKLKLELERRTTMATTVEKPAIEQYPTLTPYLTVTQAEEVIDFTKQVFGAKERERQASQSGIHCELMLGDTLVMVGGGPKLPHPAMPTALHVYVRDCDAAYERALAAGATSLSPPTDQFYGERSAGVRDVAGNYWYIATALQGDYRHAGKQDVLVYFQPRGAEGFLDFVKRAFGGEEVGVYRVGADTVAALKQQGRAAPPAGQIMHAGLRIGDTMIEMGEAHDEWQPMPTMLYLFVDDADAAQQRALAAGAKQLQPVADQPYGHRVGAVEDAWRNQWYIASVIRKK